MAISDESAPSGSGSADRSTRKPPVSMGPRENSPDHSIYAEGPIAQGGNATLHDRTGLYLAVIAMVFAAMAFGMAIVLPMVYQERIESLKDRVHLAEQTSALAREDIRVIQQALAARGIETDPHQEQRK